MNTKKIIVAISGLFLMVAAPAFADSVNTTQTQTYNGSAGTVVGDLTQSVINATQFAEGSGGVWNLGQELSCAYGSVVGGLGHFVSVNPTMEISGGVASANLQSIANITTANTGNAASSFYSAGGGGVVSGTGAVGINTLDAYGTYGGDANTYAYHGGSASVTAQNTPNFAFSQTANVFTTQGGNTQSAQMNLATGVGGSGIVATQTHQYEQLLTGTNGWTHQFGSGTTTATN